MGDVTRDRARSGDPREPVVTSRRSRGRVAHPAYPGLPARLPRDVRGFVLPVLVAIAVGLATGLAPGWTGLVLIGLPVAGLLLARVDLAAVAVLAAAAFEHDLVGLVPGLEVALLGVLVGSWLLRRLRGPLHRAGRSRVGDAVVVLLVLILVARLVRPDAGTGLDDLLRSVGLAVLALVLAEVLRGPLAPRTAALVLLAAASLAAATGVLVAAVRGEHRVSAPAGDPELMAFVLLSAVPFAFTLRDTLRRPWVADLALVLLLVGLAGTRSPVAVLGLVVVLVFAAATRQTGLPAIAAVGAALLVGVGTAALVVPDLVRPVLGRDGAARRGLTERLDGLRAAGSAARDGLDGAVHLLVLLTLVLVVLGAIAAAWSRWRTDRDPVAAAVCTALVAAAFVAVYVGVQHVVVLWLLLALAVAVAPQPVGHEPDGT